MFFFSETKSLEERLLIESAKNSVLVLRISNLMKLSIVKTRFISSSRHNILVLESKLSDYFITPIDSPNFPEYLLILKFIAIPSR